MKPIQIVAASILLIITTAAPGMAYTQAPRLSDMQAARAAPPKPPAVAAKPAPAKTTPAPVKKP